MVEAANKPLSNKVIDLFSLTLLTPSLINFNLLKEKLKKHPLDYGGGFVHNLHWIDRNCGITNEKHWNKKYATGTSIILSTKLLKEILIHKNCIEYNLIDDVAIGVLIHDFFKEVLLIDFGGHYIYANDYEGRTKHLLSEIETNNYIFYRNRSSKREVDVYQMKVILDYLK